MNFLLFLFFFFFFAGDHWVVVCNGKYWSREQRFQLKHVVTE